MTAKTETSTVPASDAPAFWLTCTYDGNGAIRDGNGDVLLGFAPRGRQTRFTGASSEGYVVERRRHAPFSSWLLFRSGELVCTIRRRGLWRGKYVLDFTDGREWTVRFPLFTVLYTCTSDEGKQLRLRLVKHTAWVVERFPASAGIALLVGLSIIQAERMKA